MSTRRDIVVCRSNEGFPASLEPRTLYVVIDDIAAREKGLVRVIDETGGDYLYPADLFMPIELSDAARRALHLAG
jgi:hypothetical protein